MLLTDWEFILTDLTGRIYTSPLFIGLVFADVNQDQHVFYMIKAGKSIYGLCEPEIIEYMESHKLYGYGKE